MTIILNFSKYYNFFTQNAVTLPKNKRMSTSWDAFWFGFLNLDDLKCFENQEMNLKTTKVIRKAKFQVQEAKNNTKLTKQYCKLSSIDTHHYQVQKRFTTSLFIWKKVYLLEKAKGGTGMNKHLLRTNKSEVLNQDFQKNTT